MITTSSHICRIYSYLSYLGFPSCPFNGHETRLGGWSFLYLSEVHRDHSHWIRDSPIICIAILGEEWNKLINQGFRKLQKHERLSNGFIKLIIRSNCHQSTRPYPHCSATEALPMHGTCCVPRNVDKSGAGVFCQIQWGARERRLLLDAAGWYQMPPASTNDKMSHCAAKCLKMSKQW